jgi:hypothetical protein
MIIDRATLLVGLITLSLLSLPFLLDLRRRRRARSTLRNALRQLSANAGCTLHQQEVSGDITIGLDKERRVLFFISRNAHAPDSRQIDLRLVRHVQVDQRLRGGQQLLERVALVFHPVPGSPAPSQLLLFEAGHGDLPGGELEIALRWSALLNELS